MTIKCPDNDTAEKLETQIIAKYGGKVDIKKVTPSQPQVKITRIYIEHDENNVENIDKEAMKAQIITQNPWLNAGTFDINKIYMVPTNAEAYANIVVNTDMKTLKLFLTKGTVIVNGRECRVFEQINLLQCVRCNKYGHFAKSCTNPANCRRCAGTHETKDCVEHQLVSRCNNCIAANKRGEDYNTRHAVTDNRCAVRRQRIEALKNYFATKN